MCYSGGMRLADIKNYYTTSILPQFKVNLRDLRWEKEKRLSGDEAAFWFVADEKEYILIWEDYSRLGSSPMYIKDELGLDSSQYKFSKPNSTEFSPSIHTPGEDAYEEYVIGSFTLLELI